jgi:hypothetical protein
LKDRVIREYGTPGTPGTTQNHGTHSSLLPNEIKVADYAELADKIWKLSRQGLSVRQIASIRFFVGGKHQMLSKSGVGRILKKAASIPQTDAKEQQQQHEVGVLATIKGQRKNRSVSSIAFGLFDKGKSAVEVVKKLAGIQMRSKSCGIGFGTIVLRHLINDI